MMYRRFILLLLGISLLVPTIQSSAARVHAEIEPGLREKASREGITGFWVVMRSQPDLSDISKSKSSRKERGNRVVEVLQQAAQGSQSSLLDDLAAGGYQAEPHWIINAIHVRGPVSLIDRIARRSDVGRISAEKTYELIQPQADPTAQPASPYSNWGLEKTGAPEVWSRYLNRGEGIVVATIDTGAQYTHPALVRQYRGSQASGTDHNYSWFDAIGDGKCSTGPCDPVGHGTHVMGIMVGQTANLAYQTGMAPAAKWIAARACSSTTCSDTDLVEAAEWMLAPRDLSGKSPRPDLRPDIINNSWGSSSAGPDEFFRAIVRAWNAAGIFSTFAAGNVRSTEFTCGEMMYPAAFPESAAIGGTDNDDKFYSYSSYHSAFGPSSALYQSQTKPDLSAPAELILSSYLDNSYVFMSGTSMAAPHVAGAVALIWSSASWYRGNVALTLQLLRTTAADIEDNRCGGTAGNNNVYGHGRLDVYAAVQQAHSLNKYWFPIISR